MSEIGNIYECFHVSLVWLLLFGIQKRAAKKEIDKKGGRKKIIASAVRKRKKITIRTECRVVCVLTITLFTNNTGKKKLCVSVENANSSSDCVD